MQKLLLSEIENAKKKLEGKIVKTPIVIVEKNPAINAFCKSGFVIFNI